MKPQRFCYLLTSMGMRGSQHHTRLFWFFNLGWGMAITQLYLNTWPAKLSRQKFYWKKSTETLLPHLCPQYLFELPDWACSNTGAGSFTSAASSIPSTGQMCFQKASANTVSHSEGFSLPGTPIRQGSSWVPGSLLLFLISVLDLIQSLFCLTYKLFFFFQTFDSLAFQADLCIFNLLWSIQNCPVPLKDAKWVITKDRGVCFPKCHGLSPLSSFTTILSFVQLIL